MLTFVTVVHVLLCVFMIFVILLQPGKDAGMGSALGGGAATSAFGGRGAVTFLSKVTGICAALFFITSLGLSFVGLKTSVVGDGTSVVDVPNPVGPSGVTDGGTVDSATTGAPPPAQSSAPPAAPTGPGPAALPEAKESPAAVPAAPPKAPTQSAPAGK
jgi:preprotein translocase subunit SecG